MNKKLSFFILHYFKGYLNINLLRLQHTPSVKVYFCEHIKKYQNRLFHISVKVKNYFTDVLYFTNTFTDAF